MICFFEASTFFTSRVKYEDIGLHLRILLLVIALFAFLAVVEVLLDLSSLDILEQDSITPRGCSHLLRCVVLIGASIYHGSMKYRICR
jgi:hypothetical protein